MRRHLVFDLDDTLVDTSKLKPYRKTRQGREFIVENVDDLPTELCHPSLLEIVESYHRKTSVSILTNSPYDYSKAILQKHGFPSDLPVIAAAKKPSPVGLRKAATQARIGTGSMLLIGDAATDILAAHSCRTPSVAVTWGFSSEKQLRRAEPQRITSDAGELEDIITGMEKSWNAYKPRASPNQYNFLPKEEFYQPTPEVDFHSVGEYVPFSSGRKDYFSGDILTFKRAKNFTIKEIVDGATDKYFYSGQIRNGAGFKSNVVSFANKAGDLLDSMDLPGKTLLVAAPNSYPEYCYKADINRVVVKMLANRDDDYHCHERRLLRRIHPKTEAHHMGDRSLYTHYKNIGMGKKEIVEIDPDNIVIFDDIKTTGTQLKSLAKLLQYFVGDANFYSLTLGETRQE